MFDGGHDHTLYTPFVLKLTVLARMQGGVSFFQILLLRKEGSHYFRALKNKCEEDDCREFYKIILNDTSVNICKYM